MNDFVKREKIFEHIKAVCLEGDGGILITSEDVLKTTIKNIPSAENKGEWIEGETFYFCGEQQMSMKCSVCGRTALNEPWTFCPNCGARMVK